MDQQTRDRQLEYERRLEEERNAQIGKFTEKTTSMTHEEVDARVESMQGLSYGLMLDTTVPKYSERLSRDIEAGPSEKMIKLRRWNWRRQRGKRRDAASGAEQERETVRAQLVQAKELAHSSAQERMPELCAHREGNDFSSWLGAARELTNGAFGEYDGESRRQESFIDSFKISSDLQEARDSGNEGRYGPGVQQAAEKARTLEGFWKRLHASLASGAAVSPDSVQPLLIEYQSKKLISGRVADEHLSELSVNNPNSCLLLMYQAVSGIVLDALTQLPRDWVNFERLKSLYAASSGVDMLCGRMVNTDDHIEKERQLEREKSEEDARLNEIRLREAERVLKETREREARAARLERERKEQQHRERLLELMPEYLPNREKWLDALARVVDSDTPPQQIKPLVQAAFDMLEKNLEQLDRRLSKCECSGGSMEYLLKNEALRRRLTLESLTDEYRLKDLLSQELEAPDADELRAQSRNACKGEDGELCRELLGKLAGEPPVENFREKIKKYAQAVEKLKPDGCDRRIKRFSDNVEEFRQKYEAALKNPEAKEDESRRAKYGLDRYQRELERALREKADDEALVEELSPYQDYITRSRILSSARSRSDISWRTEELLEEAEEKLVRQEPQWLERLDGDMQALSLAESIKEQNGEGFALFTRRAAELAKNDIIKQYPGLIYTDDAFCVKMLEANDEEFSALRDEKLQAIYKAVMAAEPILGELGMAPLLARGCAAAFVAKNGADIFERSPEAVRFMLESFAEEQKLTGEVFSKQHEALERAMDEAGVSPQERLLLHRQIMRNPPEGGEEELSALVALLYGNMKLNRPDMESALLELEIDGGQTELLREALESRLCDAPEQFDRLLRERCVPEKLPSRALPLMKKSRSEQFCTQLLLSEKLLGAEEFEGAFIGRESELLKAFSQLMQEGAFRKYGVKSDMKLESMSGEVSVGSFTRLTGELRANLRKYRAAWQELPAFRKDVLQARLLPEMLRGKMDTDGFNAEYEKQRALLLREEKSEEKAFELELLHPYAADFPVFDVQQQTRGGGFSDGSRVVRRLSRFREAAEKKASGKLKTAKTVEEKYSDYGEELIRELEADGSVHELSKEDYEKRVEQLGARALAREKVFGDFLREQGLDRLGEGTPERKLLDMAMPRMRALFVHLKDKTDGDDWREKNLSEFGVASLTEAANRLSELIKNTPDEQLQLITEMEKIRTQRLEALKQGDDGVLEPLLPHMEQSREFRLALTTATPEEFEKTVSALRQRALLPMKLIYGFSGGHKFLAEQLTLRLSGRILNEDGSAMAEQDWYELIRQEENRLMEFEVGGVSIFEQRELLLRNKTLQPFVSVILETEDMGFLSDKKRTKQVIKRYEENIRANTRLAKEQIRRALELERGDVDYKAKLKRLEFGYPRAMQRDMARLTPEEFSLKLEGSLEEYMAADERMTIETAKIELRMSEMEQKRARVDRMKQLGREEERDIGFSKLRDKALKDQRLGLTPLMRLYGTKKPVKLTDEKKKQGLDMLHGKPPCYDVKDSSADAMLFELIRAGVEPEFAAYQAARSVFHGGLEDYAERALMEGAANSGEEPDYELKTDFWHYVLVTRRDLTGQSPALSDEENKAIIKGAVLEFVTKQAAMRRLRVLRAEEDSDPVIRCEINDALNVFSYEYYTMNARELKAAVEDRIRYIENSHRLSAAIDHSLEEYAAKKGGLSDSSRQRIKMGLRDCFHARMLRQDYTRVEAFAPELEDIFADETLLRYIEDSNALMSGISSDSLAASEITTNTLLDREGFAAQLAELASKKQLAAYNELTTEQRRLFAYRLSAPADISKEETGFSTDISRKMGRSELAVNKVRRALKNYSEGAELEADIDYTAAMNRLCVGGKLSVAVFSETLAEIKRLDSMHEACFERDFELLGGSGNDTLRLARRVKKKLPVITPAAGSADALISRLSELDGDGTNTELLQRVKELDRADWKLLLLILQDRTMTDLSTRPTGGIDGETGEREFVNERGRERFLTRARTHREDILKLPVPASVYQNALSTLLGYQIRDDKRVWAGGLDESCLVGLERQTLIDWELLKRSLQMLDKANER